MNKRIALCLVACISYSAQLYEKPDEDAAVVAVEATWLDADMLAETARAELGLYAPNDVIISIDLSNLKFSDSSTEDDVN